MGEFESMKKLSMMLCCGLTLCCYWQSKAQNLPIIDGVVKRSLITEKTPLAYENVREADVLWEKKVWRVIDLREKINLSFANPQKIFFEIIHEAAKKGEIVAYSSEDDKFSKVIPVDDVKKVGVSIDTLSMMDEVSGDYIRKEVINDLDYENVKQLRVKEVWYFDKKTASIQVRIIGIAPLIDEYDDNGNFKYTRPLYWVYYPNCRNLLAKEPFSSVAENDANPTSWEDALEMRLFSSYITKESNIYDRRLQDYLANVDLLLEGEKIQHSIFNYEQDMWSY
jgi:gliding motility associated protien GldN